jgi:hypothetical protein
MNERARKLKEEFNVMGIPYCGVLTSHLVVAVCAGLGLLPKELLLHAEVPPNTGYEKIFDNAGVSAAGAVYSSKVHYEHTQQVLKAVAKCLNVTVAVAEEIICQVKRVNTSEPITGTHSQAKDTVFPGIPYMVYNPETGVIEGWRGATVCPVTPLFVIIEALDFVQEVEKPFAFKKGFFEVVWPNKHKKTMKKRSTAVEIPLHKMCKVTTVRIVSAAEAEHLCGGIGNAQYDVIMKKGDKV